MAKEKAIVLFEPLSWFSQEETLRIEYQSEPRVLFDVDCLLGKALSETFLEIYVQNLESEPNRIKDKA